MTRLEETRVLMFVEDVYEDLELWYPKLRLQEAGVEVLVAGPETGTVYRGKHGYPCEADARIQDQRADDFDALVLPGGFAPDKLRRDEVVLRLTREIFEAGKPLAHICHAGWIPLSAGIVRGYHCTSTPGIKDDLTNAGAIWEDAAVVVDRTMISSRRPPDLPDFCRAILTMLERKPVA